MQALLVLDVMNGIFELPVPLHDPDGFVERVGELLDGARVRRVPVVHFRQLGPEGALFGPGARAREFHPRVAPAPDEIVIDKREPDANAVLSAQQIVKHHEVVLTRFARVVPAAEIAFM